MLKLAVVACLLAVCVAQPPPEPERPDIPETFVSTFEFFDDFDRREKKGDGKWDRSMEKKSFMESMMSKSANGSEDFEEHLGLFVEHEIYRINTTMTGKRMCSKETIPETAEFPMVWDWLKEAKYHRFEDHRTNKTFDAWSEYSDRGSRTLLVSEMDRNKPYAIMERGHRPGDFEDRRFITFTPEEPPATVFEVPSECRTPPPPRRHQKYN